MTKTIFRNTFLVGFLVLLLCGGLVFWVQYTQTMEETFAALQQEAVYAEQGMLLGGTAYLSALGNVNRVTWIDADGSVRYDSEFPLPLASQEEYAEVRAALSSGEGRGIRTSEDSGESTMYYALKCDDGTILRLSRPLRAVREAWLTVSPVLLLLVLVLLISVLLSFRAARQIVKPINSLDLDNPEMNPYPELSPLIRRIHEQKKTIQEEASRREMLRREFSANVSHELKTPLTSISGFAELMAQGGVESDRVQEFSRDIYKESHRLIALIDDIIRLSRLDEEAVSPERETADLYQIAEEVLDSLRPTAEKQQIALQLTGEHAKVSGIYRLLSEMIYNLCDNAIKYNRPGGRVTVDISCQDGQPRLTVSDTGIGIPPEQQKRVFERFYRVNKSHSREIGGTGLGLSIVKHGAQYHGAQIELESEPEAGTRISLIFGNPNATEAL